MQSKYVLESLNDALLLERLQTIVAKNNQWTAVLLAHIAEVDRRKLYLGAASCSMYDYCVKRLKLSEGGAFKRIHAARAARRFPVIFELVESGALHLAGITVLAPHLTEENHRELLAKASHQTKRANEELVASIAPKPDVPSTMRRLPTTGTPPLLVLAATSPRATSPLAPANPQPPPSTSPPPRPAEVPLSRDRFKIQFTASRALRNKIATAQALMRHRVPDGDLEEIFEEAIDLLLTKLNRKKFASTDKPKAAAPQAEAERPTEKRTRHIPASIIRPVVRRDGLECSFVDVDGRRCSTRAFLEFHHEQPFAKGGEHSVENVRVLCRAHNAYLAEREYGPDFVRRKQARPAAEEPARSRSSSSDAAFPGERTTCCPP